jgi:hypothetical protein
MSDLLQQGVDALQAGEKVKARRLLSRAIQADPYSEQAWLCLFKAVDNDQERLTCLQKALAINPGNEAAQRAMAMLKEKQASQPAPTTSPYPWINRSDTEQPSPSPQCAPDRVDHSCGLKDLDPEQRKALEGYAQLIAQELASGRSRKEIVERLVQRGFPRKAVKQLVRKAKAKRFL